MPSEGTVSLFWPGGVGRDSYTGQKNRLDDLLGGRPRLQHLSWLWFTHSWFPPKSPSSQRRVLKKPLSYGLLICTQTKIYKYQNHQELVRSKIQVNKPGLLGQNDSAIYKSNVTIVKLSEITASMRAGR